MPAGKKDSQERAVANINLKVTEDERWAFKEWCAKNRISQVDAFRRAFILLKHDTSEHIADDLGSEEI